MHARVRRGRPEKLGEALLGGVGRVIHTCVNIVPDSQFAYLQNGTSLGTAVKCVRNLSQVKRRDRYGEN